MPAGYSMPGRRYADTTHRRRLPVGERYRVARKTPSDASAK